MGPNCYKTLNIYCLATDNTVFLAGTVSRHLITRKKRIHTFFITYTHFKKIT